MAYNNRNNQYHLLILSMLTLYSTNLLGIILSVSIDHKDHKTICRIGEVHRSLYRSTDPWGPFEERDKNKLLQLIELSSKCKEPVAFILEASNHANESVKNIIPLLHQTNPQSKIGSYFALPLFAQQHNNQKQNAHFILADIRGPVLRELCEVFSLFEGPEFTQNMVLPLLLGIQSVDLSEQENNDPETMLALNNLITTSKPQTLDALLSKSPKLRNYYFGKGGPYEAFQKNYAKLLNGYPISALDEEIEKAKRQLHVIMDSYRTTANQ